MKGRLAIAGGKPVRQAYLPYGRQTVDDDDIKAVLEVLRSDWLTTGPKVKELEEAFAAYVAARHAVAFSSGTAGLHAAAFAAGLKSGDEAITSPLTFAASANCLLYRGAKPVFADVEDLTLLIDPEKIKARLTSQTKAILPVDYTGQPVDLDTIHQLAATYGLTVIEDAAHALGATYRERCVGSLSAMTVFSMHPVKQITTGEGGMVTTNDPNLARQLRIFRNHGITTEAQERVGTNGWYYEMVELGYNYRLSDIHCALGISQLKKLNVWLQRRRAIAEHYNQAFKELDTLRIPVVKGDRESAWHLYVIRLNLDHLRTDRNEVFRALRAENIGVNVHYIPVHLHPFYREKLGTRAGLCPIAEKAYAEILSLPIFPAMTDSDVEDVIEAVYKVTEIYRK